jgi:hypothetical protein
MHDQTTEAARLAVEIVDLGATLESVVVEPLPTWPQAAGSPAVDGVAGAVAAGSRHRARHGRAARRSRGRTALLRCRAGVPVAWLAPAGARGGPGTRVAVGAMAGDGERRAQGTSRSRGRLGIGSGRVRERGRSRTPTTGFQKNGGYTRQFTGLRCGLVPFADSGDDLSLWPASHAPAMLRLCIGAAIEDAKGRARPERPPSPAF